MNRDTLKVLIAEDNPTNLGVCKHFLEQAGVSQIWTAEDGVAVLRLLEEDSRRFHLILMDVRMPEKDGIETTMDIISRWPEREGRPTIVALTAHAFVEETRRCMDAGMDACLSKPLRLPELESVLDMVVRGQDPAQPEPDSENEKVNHSSSATIDWKQFDMIIDAPESPCVEILRKYVSSMEDTLSQLRDSASLGESEAVIHLTHQARGAASSFGLTTFHERIREAELEAKKADPDSLQQLADPKWSEKTLKLLKDSMARIQQERDIVI